MTTAKQKVYTVLAIFDTLCFIVLFFGILIHFDIIGGSDSDSEQISGSVPDSEIFTDADFEEAEEVVFE